MPTVREVSVPYANFMLSPALAPPPLCATCFDFVTGDYTRCYRCGRQPSLLSAVLPISYSVGGGQPSRAALL